MSTKDHVAVRLDNETLHRIDAIRALLDTEWRDATRSDVLRLLILKGLEHFEKKHRTELDKRRVTGLASEGGASGSKRTASRRGASGKAGGGTSKAGASGAKRGAKKKGSSTST